MIYIDMYEEQVKHVSIWMSMIWRWSGQISRNIIYVISVLHEVSWNYVWVTGFQVKNCIGIVTSNDSKQDFWKSPGCWIRDFLLDHHTSLVLSPCAFSHIVADHDASYYCQFVLDLVPCNRRGLLWLLRIVLFMY